MPGGVILLPEAMVEHGQHGVRLGVTRILLNRLSQTVQCLIQIVLA
jgi:hypothetical protein